MDTKFSVAVHVLILISEAPAPVSSEQMAESVGTNASYIRKILALLKKAEIVDSHRGISGYSLTIASLRCFKFIRRLRRRANLIFWISTKTQVTGVLLGSASNRC